MSEEIIHAGGLRNNPHCGAPKLGSHVSSDLDKVTCNQCWVKLNPELSLTQRHTYVQPCSKGTTTMIPAEALKALRNLSPMTTHLAMDASNDWYAYTSEPVYDPEDSTWDTDGVGYGTNLCYLIDIEYEGFASDSLTTAPPMFSALGIGAQFTEADCDFTYLKLTHREYVVLGEAHVFKLTEPEAYAVIPVYEQEEE